MSERDRERAEHILGELYGVNNSKTAAELIAAEFAAVRAEATQAERERCMRIATKFAEEAHLSRNMQEQILADRIAERIREGGDV